MALEKNGEFVNGKHISLRIPNTLWKMIEDDKTENTSINELIYNIILTHYTKIDQSITLENLDVISKQIANAINDDFSEKNNEGLLVESYLQIIRSKILKELSKASKN